MEYILQPTTPIDKKRILLRVDFNVPIKNGKIEDPARIEAAIPTITYLLKKDCEIILISHLGNPKGQFDPSLSLKPIAEFLSQKLHMPIKFYPHDSTKPLSSLKIDPHQKISLLDNLRFQAAEEEPSKDLSFAKSLASLADIYIDDAFACAHRPHSSIVTVVDYFKNKAYLGLLMAKELSALNNLIHQPKKPYLAILGGAKVSSKIKVIESLLNKVDALMIGGGMSVPFLKAQKKHFFSPLADLEAVEFAKKIMTQADKKKIPIFLPEDLVVSKSLTSAESLRIVKIDQGSFEDEIPVDIGPITISTFCEKISNYQTIFWNGPMGVFEVPPFDQGTALIADAIAHHQSFSVIGGGDSAYAAEKLGFKNKFSHVSTGGGASIEFLEKGTLPGIEAVKLAHQA